jgi:hypothetical protein
MVHISAYTEAVWYISQHIPRQYGTYPSIYRGSIVHIPAYTEAVWYISQHIPRQYDTYHSIYRGSVVLSILPPVTLRVYCA